MEVVLLIWPRLAGLCAEGMGGEFILLFKKYILNIFKKGQSRECGVSAKDPDASRRFKSPGRTGHISGRGGLRSRLGIALCRQSHVLNCFSLTQLPIYASHISYTTQTAQTAHY